MPKRFLRLTPEFVEDFTALSKDPEWCDKVNQGVYRVFIGIDHEDGYKLSVPIKLHRDEYDTLTIEWEITPEEHQFETIVFRKLREE